MIHGPADPCALMEYEYRGLMAQTWDLFRGDTSRWDDRFFYLEVIRRHGQPVLDVGCGTGRRLLDFAQQGIDVDGVDVSPEMLALCRDKAGMPRLHPIVYQQAMEALALPRTYRTILVPSSSFQLLTDRGQARALYREAGFPEPAVYRGFTFDPAGPDEAIFTLVADKTGA